MHVRRSPVYKTPAFTDYEVLSNVAVDAGTHTKEAPRCQGLEDRGQAKCMAAPMCDGTFVGRLEGTKMVLVPLLIDCPRVNLHDRSCTGHIV